MDAAPTTPTPEERTLGMAAHLLAFAGYIVPFGHVIGPLVLWLMKKDQSPFVGDQGKESVNFQISITIYYIVSALLLLVLIGFVLMFAVFVFDVVFVIIAAIRANEGKAYRYPLCIRFIR